MEKEYIDERDRKREIKLLSNIENLSRGVIIVYYFCIKEIKERIMNYFFLYF